MIKPEYTEAVALIAESLGTGYAVSLHEVDKNNEKRMGVVIREGDEMASPTIYIDDMPNDAEYIATTVIAIYQEEKKHELKWDIEKYINKEYILSAVYPALISRERNMDKFLNIPHEPFLDLEIIFKVDITPINSETERGSFIIKNDLMEKLKISQEELWNNSMQNIKGQYRPYDFIPAFKVMTNKDKSWGAGVVLDNEALEKVHEDIGGDFYLLPSSVHEMIAISADTIDDLDYIRGMVKEINGDETVISRNDYLSDTVYIYSNGELKIAG